MNIPVTYVPDPLKVDGGGTVVPQALPSADMPITVIPAPVLPPVPLPQFSCTLVPDPNKVDGGGIVEPQPEPVSNIPVTYVPPRSTTLPTVYFTAAPTSGEAPLSVVFTNESTLGVYFTWDFGDGTTSNSVSPTHIYTGTGTYTVELAGIDASGTTYYTRENYIAAVNSAPPAPVADFTATPLTGDAPLSVTFTNLSTNGTYFTWDFGDGTIVNNP
jgi:PKD repeat protein